MQLLTNRETVAGINNCYVNMLEINKKKKSVLTSFAEE